MCLYPKLIKNRKYISNKKNGGKIPPVLDERTRLVAIGCQNCMECRKQKSREWQARLMEDLKENKNGKFITLTFSDQSIKEISETIPTLQGYELDNEIATRATRLFLERWRKKYSKSIRHWLVTELGHNGTENIHLHGIIWTDETLYEVERIWKYGYIWKGKMKNGKLTNYVNEQTINYITKYVNKIDEKHTTYKSKILTSQGIGGNYTKKQLGNWNKNIYKEKETDETYRMRNGYKIGIPIYWRNKIYTEEQREKLWIEKLNKNERWILGNKIDISKGEEEYYKALKYAQETNKRLGYKDDTKDWNKEQYERERRIIMQKERIKKANAKLAGSGSQTECCAHGIALLINPQTNTSG